MVIFVCNFTIDINIPQSASKELCWRWMNRSTPNNSIKTFSYKFQFKLKCNKSENLIFRSRNHAEHLISSSLALLWTHDTAIL